MAFQEAAVEGAVAGSVFEAIESEKSPADAANEVTLNPSLIEGVFHRSLWSSRSSERSSSQGDSRCDNSRPATRVGSVCEAPLRPRRLHVLCCLCTKQGGFHFCII
jgi:hypothetical protein